jgi:hypothetical protein
LIAKLNESAGTFELAVRTNLGSPKVGDACLNGLRQTPVLFSNRFAR